MRVDQERSLTLKIRYLLVLFQLPHKSCVPRGDYVFSKVPLMEFQISEACRPLAHVMKPLSERCGHTILACGYSSMLWTRGAEETGGFTRQNQHKRNSSQSS